MSSTIGPLTRRAVLQHCAAASFAFPAVMRAHVTAAPSETLYHASFGASGMAGSDIGSLTASPYVKLVAVADVDSRNLAPDQETISRREGLPGLARAARQGEEPQLGQRLDSGPHARPDHHAGDATRAARLHARNR